MSFFYCDFLRMFLCCDLKLEVSAYDCFRRDYDAILGNFFKQTLDYIFYNLYCTCFFPKVEATLLDFCFCVEAIQTNLYCTHCLIREWSFLKRGFCSLMVGFEFLDTSPTQRQSHFLMSDSTPVHAGYNSSHCERDLFPPCDGRYLIPALKESQLSVYFC